MPLQRQVVPLQNVVIVLLPGGQILVIELKPTLGVQWLQMQYMLQIIYKVAIIMLFFINWVQKQPSRLGKVVLKICSKFTGVHRCRSVISKVVKQLYWNHTSTRLVGWVQVNWKRFWLHLSQTGITNRPFTCTFTNFRFTQDKLALKPNPYFSLELALLCYKGFAHYYKQRLEYPHR